MWDPSGNKGYSLRLAPSSDGKNILVKLRGSYVQNSEIQM